MGSLINFPRAGARQSDGKRHEPADNASHSSRSSAEPSLVTWIDANRQRDSEDDGGGGGSAA